MTTTDGDREHGNRPDPDEVRPDGPMVGRIAGQDEGYAGPTGAERRAEEAEQR